MNRSLPLLFLSAALLAGCAKSGQKDADDTPPAAAQETASHADNEGNPVVSLSAETQKRIGLETAPVAPAEIPSAITAYGTILDPTPLVALQGELAADQAGAEAAKKIAARERALYADDQTTSRKSVEAAETDEAAANIKTQNARQSLRLSWGDAIANLSFADRGQLVDKLVAHRVVLARVDLPIGAAISNLPSSASISAAGHTEEVEAHPLSFAGTVDPRTLGQGVILRVDNPAPLLAPGASIRALLATSAPAQSGVVVPESAVVHFNGLAWLYSPSGETNFIRREIQLDRPAVNGWFVINGLAAGDKIVTVGAALLLSEEQKASAPAAD